MKTAIHDHFFKKKFRGGGGAGRIIIGSRCGEGAGLAGAGAGFGCGAGAGAGFCCGWGSVCGFVCGTETGLGCTLYCGLGATGVELGLDLG